jgi:hypothetical protein
MLVWYLTAGRLETHRSIDDMQLPPVELSNTAERTRALCPDRIRVGDRLDDLSWTEASGQLLTARKRVAGIEPAWPAWKAGALPLSYTRTSAI